MLVPQYTNWIKSALFSIPNINRTSATGDIRHIVFTIQIHNTEKELEINLG